MTRIRWRVMLIAFAGTLAVPLSASAHHSFTMFEMDRDVTYEGIVERYEWRNPHVHIIMRVDPGPGIDPRTVGRWDVEGGSTVIMGRQGWNRATYRPGDPIELVGHPLKSGEKGISLFYAILPDGGRLYHDIARPPDDPAE
jgi:hypothetical protein